LICNTITAASRPEFIEEFRRRNPKGKVISLAGGSERAVVDGSIHYSGPEELLRFIKELFQD
jgi:hypothetical protein